MINNLRKIYIYTSWLPLAMYIAAYYIILKVDGWGQWASAPLFIPSLLSSFVYAVVGIYLLTMKPNQLGMTKHFLFSLLLSSSVALWFFVKYLIIEIKMSF
jgi:hypothetical protein